MFWLQRVSALCSANSWMRHFSRAASTACASANVRQHPQNAVIEQRPRTYRVGMFGVKVGMTGEWDSEGNAIPVTLLRVPRAYILTQQDAAPAYCGRMKPGKPRARGFNVRVGAEPVNVRNRLRRVSTARIRECQSAGVPPMKLVGGFYVTALPKKRTIEAKEHYTPGGQVDVQGVSKGKGFQGVMKRWGFHGMPATHGVTKTHRRPGSIGGCQDPGRVLKGQKMPGHMGGDWRCARNLTVIRVRSNVMYLKGCIPGNVGARVRIHDAVHVKRAIAGPLP